MEQDDERKTGESLAGILLLSAIGWLLLVVLAILGVGIFFPHR